jgi:flagellar M-ring protein FliF
MDSFNRAAAQVRELFESMTPSARLLAGLLLAVVVISLGPMFRSGTDAPEESLFSGDYLPESQLNRIEAAIAQAGLTGHRREGRRIWVPAEQKAAYLAAVADADALPPNFNSMLERALENGNPLESGVATRERLKIIKQQTLSEIVRAMHWVEDAVVLYDEQEPHGLSGERQVIGSVSVKPKRGESLDAKRTHTLQTLVAHAVVGLRPDDVAVTNLGEGGANDSDAGVPAEVLDDDCCRACVAYEQYKRQSILNALSDIPGVRVEVNAEPAEATDEATCDVTTQRRAASQGAGQESTLSPSATPGGRTGTFAKGPSRTLDKENVADQAANDAPVEASEVDGASAAAYGTPPHNGFTPKRVWATVTIPHNYIEGIWQQSHIGSLGGPTDADLRAVQEGVIAKVESIVEPLLPRPDTNEVAEKPVRVVVLESVSATPLAASSLTSQAWTWASGRRSTMAVLGLAALGLLALRWGFPSGREMADQVKGSGVRLRRAQSSRVQGSDAIVQRRTPDSEPPNQLRFDDLAHLDSSILAGVIQEVDPDVMALALTGANDTLMERIIGQIPRNVAKTLRQQLLRLGPTRLRDVEAAQQVVAAVAARLLDPTHTSQRAA